MASQIRFWWKLFRVFLALCWHLTGLLVLNFIRGKSIERGFQYRRRFCKSALSILRIQIRVTGHIHHGVCLYVSNHRSMLDPLVQLSILDTFILSKAEVSGYPVMGRGARETGVIMVDRGDRRSRSAALDKIEHTLRRGHQVMIYPEGTTYGGELTGDFRKSAIELAQHLQIPVIPVMIEYPGPDYYWVTGSLLGYFKRFFSGSSTLFVKVMIGHPLQANDHADLTSLAREKINSMILEAREKGFVQYEGK